MPILSLARLRKSADGRSENALRDNIIKPAFWFGADFDVRQ
jgi:hypothetical protein